MRAIAVLVAVVAVFAVSVAAEGPRSLFHKAQKATDRADFKTAIESFEKLLALPELRDTDRPAALNGLATAYAQSGLQQRAVETFQKLVDLLKARVEERRAKKKAPDEEDVMILTQSLFNLAYTHDSMGNLPQALAAYEESIRVDRKFAQARAAC